MSWIQRRFSASYQHSAEWWSGTIRCIQTSHWPGWPHGALQHSKPGRVQTREQGSLVRLSPSCFRLSNCIRRHLHTQTYFLSSSSHSGTDVLRAQPLLQSVLHGLVLFRCVGILTHEFKRWYGTLEYLGKNWNYWSVLVLLVTWHKVMQKWSSKKTALQTPMLPWIHNSIYGWMDIDAGRKADRMNSEAVEGVCKLKQLSVCANTRNREMTTRSGRRNWLLWFYCSKVWWFQPTCPKDVDAELCLSSATLNIIAGQ